MSKAFSALAKFLHSCLTASCSKISRGPEGVAHFTMLKNNVGSLVESASDPKIWRNPKLLMKEYAASKSKHKRNLFPGLKKSIADSVKTWNTSSQNEELIQGVFQIHRSMKGGVSPGDFNKFTKYTIFSIGKHFVVLSPGNRYNCLIHRHTQPEQAECGHQPDQRAGVGRRGRLPG